MVIAPELAGIAHMGVLPAPAQDAEHVVAMGDVWLMSAPMPDTRLKLALMPSQ